MSRFLWVLVIGAALLVTSSASAQRGGGKGKNKNRDFFPGQGDPQGLGRNRGGDPAGDQPSYGRFRGGDSNDPGGDPSSFGRGRGGPEGRMTMTFGGDPSQIFDGMSGGKNVLSRNDLDPGRQRFFDMLARAGNVSGDTMSRQQFSTAFDQMRSGAGGSTMFNMRGDGGGRGPGGRSDPDQVNLRAENTFRRMDTDQDGLLQFEEMSDRLRENWKHYDSNNDGAISLDEFKAYMSELAAQRAESGNVGRGPSSDGLPGVDGRPTVEEIRKPVVYRHGQLPRDIPAWFEQLDTDRDGQVGMYEWVKDGRSVEDFQRLDRNDDGFLTVEEVMADVRAQSRQPGDSTSMYARADSGTSGGRGGPGFGGPGGGRGRGPGGPNGDGMGPRGPGGRGRGFGGPNSEAGPSGSEQFPWMQNPGGGPGGRGRGLGGPDAQNGGGPGGGRRGRGGQNGENGNGGLGGPGGGRRGFGGGNGNE
jgi:EF-hand domain pair/EF hand